MDEVEKMEFTLDIVSNDETEEELDALTRRVLQEVKATSVESAVLARKESPVGSKGDPITLGSIAIVVLPAILPSIIEIIHARVLRGSNRTVKIKGKINGHTVDFEGSSESLQKLLSAFESKEKGVKKK